VNARTEARSEERGRPGDGLRSRLERLFAQVDWGGLPTGMVQESIARYATTSAPELRAG
jgi:hypothetical protein